MRFEPRGRSGPPVADLPLFSYDYASVGGALHHGERFVPGSVTGVVSSANGSLKIPIHLATTSLEPPPQAIFPAPTSGQVSFSNVVFLVDASPVTARAGNLRALTGKVLATPQGRVVVDGVRRDRSGVIDLELEQRFSASPSADLEPVGAVRAELTDAYFVPPDPGSLTAEPKRTIRFSRSIVVRHGPVRLAFDEFGVRYKGPVPLEGDPTRCLEQS